MEYPPLKPFHPVLPAPLVGAVWLLGCGLVDWLTGPELALSAFYLPGIIVPAWYSGRKAALWLALFGTALWLTAELLEPRYSNPFIPYWNSLIRLTVFAVTALLTSEVRIRQLTETALQHQKEILSSILDSMRDGVVVANGEGRIIVFNPAAIRLFGEAPLNVDANEWVTRMERNLLDPTAGSPHDKHLLRKSLSGQHSGQGEISLIGRGSSGRIQLGLTALPLMSRNSDRTGTVLVFNDLTSRRNLEKQISQASEREQRRIGQDLHDGICQHLAGVAFAAGTLQSELETMNLPKQAEKTASIGRLVREGIQQTKDLARGLYPMGIEEGLDVALASLASTTRARLGIQCTYRQTGEGFKLDPNTAGHLYRISQEAVTNAVVHGKPENILIHLSRDADNLILEVSDDGTGIGTARNPESGIGLQIMSYRADLVGAKMEVTSREGSGTRICCKASLPT